MGPSVDNDPDFTDAFCGFLQNCVTSVDAAELLLVFTENPAQAWAPRELITRMASVTTLSEPDVQRYLECFEQHALISRDEDRRARYAPGSAYDPHLATLARVYLERPVTLFRVIYGLRDTKIKTFADAFKLRR